MSELVVATPDPDTAAAFDMGVNKWHKISNFQPGWNAYALDAMDKFATAGSKRFSGQGWISLDRTSTTIHASPPVRLRKGEICTREPAATAAPCLNPSTEYAFEAVTTSFTKPETPIPDSVNARRGSNDRNILGAFRGVPWGQIRTGGVIASTDSREYGRLERV
ncbi:hypothetical protein HDU90_005327 [Geranomyces variabilis]|nr:hypothetical protein HDU90_005327 [Geranomyces variabilis]